MFRGLGSQSLHIIRGPRVEIDGETPGKHPDIIIMLCTVTSLSRSAAFYLNYTAVHLGAVHLYSSGASLCVNDQRQRIDKLLLH